ncbi:probable pectinesterase/pectinesterase inhibitor 51 [Salvia hispanica]|uniref:probable pectinesterase/pectinesterase inhibitor 51 n=1 Tax=Salvia hispanica TaxID=49212 RepID=UPI002009CFAC|nr:probable pectinesterase/pectinesterase inhibitor 51 [Salvia hispanica]
MAADDETHRKSKFTAILVVVLICCSLILFTVIYNIYTPHHRKFPVYSNAAVIHGACRAARNQSGCEASLKSEWRAAGSSPATALQAINASLQVSTRHLREAIATVEKILDGSADNVNRSDTSRLCLEVLRHSDARAAMSADAVPRGADGVRDARAWMSASLAYQYGCMSGLKNVNDTPLVAEAVAFFNTTLIGSTADVLAMMASYDYFGEETSKWGPPKTERDGFWPSRPAAGEEVVGGVPSGMAVNVTVCGGAGGCDYETVQGAVDAAPENSSGRFVIWIKAGAYKETVRVGFEKKNVVFLGDGMGKTVITGALNVGMPRVSTYNSATVGVLGDGFMASNLTIENTAGVDAHQAVAFRSDSDLSVLENCELLGNQDTLYAHSLRQYYKSCRIQGNIDFIFGQSAAVFQDCLLLIVPHQNEPEKGDNNAVTAHGRIDPAQSTGFVFRNCVVNGTEEYMALYAADPAVHKTYLGRPWKEYSRTVFLGCTLESLVSVDGWMPWSGDFALETLYYGEFQNKGLGSDTSKRVNWSSVVPAEHVDSYSLQNFIQGDHWIPNTLSSSL